MPRPSKDQLDKFWDFADKNGDGKLSIMEFRSAVLHYHKQGGNSKCAPPSNCDIAKMFSGMNDDNDQFLSRDEYMKHVAANERNKCNMEAAFREFDKDGDGTISRNELIKVLKANGYSADLVDGIIKQCDKDGDGEINMEEFMAMM